MKKARFCKYCGHEINRETKVCTGCGKKYSAKKLLPLFLVLFLVAVLAAYVCVNYFLAVSAMNDRNFVKAQRLFDNLLISEVLFADQYNYVKVGTSLENKKYADALVAAEKLDSDLASESFMEELREKVYEEGQNAYQKGNTALAKERFTLLKEYRRSKDYLFLMSWKEYGYAASLNRQENYEKLVSLIGFEDAHEAILSNDFSFRAFMLGKWSAGSASPYHFTLKGNADGAVSATYTLPAYTVYGNLYMSEGIVSVGESESSAKELFRFSIIGRNQVSVYCFLDGNTCFLYRQ